MQPWWYSETGEIVLRLFVCPLSGENVYSFLLKKKIHSVSRQQWPDVSLRQLNLIMLHFVKWTGFERSGFFFWKSGTLVCMRNKSAGVKNTKLGFYSINLKNDWQEKSLQSKYLVNKPHINRHGTRVSRPFEGWKDVFPPPPPSLPPCEIFSAPDWYTAPSWCQSAEAPGTEMDRRRVITPWSDAETSGRSRSVQPLWH